MMAGVRSRRSMVLSGQEECNSLSGRLRQRALANPPTLQEFVIVVIQV